uniref:Succinate-semialdehyde dehydrogenase, mitochondrial n=1 Tax=Lygus hesperus TaxID=30085 RepID=A0A0A9XQ92_LYGHE
MESFAVRKVAFTGSTSVGKELYAQASHTMKKVGMELGGNAPLIVFDDADLDRAVSGVLSCKFRNAGQTCICCNRVLVQRGMYETFIQELVRQVKELKVGNSFDPESKIGALINAQAVDHVHSLVMDAVGKGAEIEVGGAPLDGKGAFYPPTVLSNVDHTNSRCCQE